MDHRDDYVEPEDTPPTPEPTETMLRWREVFLRWDANPKREDKLQDFERWFSRRRGPRLCVTCAFNLAYAGFHQCVICLDRRKRGRERQKHRQNAGDLR